jgi:hypothetical protein
VKELAYDKFTNFCAAVKFPPKALIEAVNSVVEGDPATWLPVVAWLNRIIEMHKALGCGDV